MSDGERKHTFTIKQQFAEGFDPDAIAVAFRQHIQQEKAQMRMGWFKLAMLHVWFWLLRRVTYRPRIMIVRECVQVFTELMVSRPTTVSLEHMPTLVGAFDRMQFGEPLVSPDGAHTIEAQWAQYAQRRFRKLYTAYLLTKMAGEKR